MKTTKFIFSVSLFCLWTLAALSAQNCTAYFPFEKGAMLEYTNYDDKGKVQSSMTQKVLILDDDEKEGLTAQIESKIMDKNGKESMRNSYHITCKNDTLFMDLTAQMPQLTEAFSTMEVTITGDQLLLPPKLSVGQTLPDANMQIQAGTGGMNLMKMTVAVTDRKVEAKESVTTSAGTYDCYKISHTTNTKMLVGKSFKTITWYADKVGMVKTETYDKKGKLESSMQLTKFSKE
ncbi:MAG: hypothetical protein SFU99_06525 [Saprospiraceae bacterium]|nr:hypothetical protein [Saprospiraceae bacterium]